MGTHPIFESDFDCLTDKKSVWSTYQRLEKPSLRSLTSTRPSRSPSTKLERPPSTLRESVVTTENSPDTEDRQNPSFTRRPKPPKRSCSDSSALNPRRRSFWSSSDASISNLEVTRREEPNDPVLSCPILNT